MNDQLDPTTGEGDPSRRAFLGLGAGLAALACSSTGAATGVTGATARSAPRSRKGHPVLVGSANALPGMQQHYARLQEGAEPLDVAIDEIGRAHV